MAGFKYTLLEVAKKCNNVSDVEELYSSGEYYRLFADNGALAGIVHRSDVLPLEEECVEQHKQQPVFVFDHKEKTIRFNKAYKTEPQRSAALAGVLNELRVKDKWPGLRKWRDELYPIYKGEANSPSAMVERASSYTLGIRAFGVHINGYVRPADDDGQLRMWISKRSATKQTWPGFLDNMVAGGISNGDGAFASVIKECEEEAGLSADFVAPRVRSAGTIQYLFSSKLGMKPETQYVYDIEMPADVIPRPSDGEVEEFYLLPIDKVLEKVRAGLFKPNCALCVIDFLIRHGIVTAENEPDYLEIIDNIHARLPFPGV
ncbi:hypothetical protein IWW48_006246 [Coemansia sp. RSA 1200]|nr:hypothetical protein IWW48_006246 [Coemansia sp. RSA 1200]